MATTDEVPPLDAPANPAAPTADADPTADRAPAAEPGTQDTLSPAVRRLVRQFDLDITGIHGTGPDGRIRVGDVMALLGGRTDTGNRDAPPKPPPETASDEDSDSQKTSAATEPAQTPGSPEPALAAAPPTTPAPAAAPTTTTVANATTTVFDCDVSRVLSHRKRLRDANVDVFLTSYFLVALAEAQYSAPELTGGAAARFGVSLTGTDGEQHTTLIDTATAALGDSLDSRLHAFDAALRQNLDADVANANLLVHHYGDSGGLLATPTPLGAGHAASAGVGRVRREIAVRNVDSVELHVAARCYVSLSFVPDRIALHRANRFMVVAVHVIEHWPE